jgi:hypothetical protein
MAGASGMRYIFDPAAGAYYDTVTGTHVATVPAQTTGTTFDGAPSSGTVEAYPQLSSISPTGLSGGESTMMMGPATIVEVPESGLGNARYPTGDPIPNALVPDGYRTGNRAELSDTTYLGDATTEQIPVPPSLYPQSGWGGDPAATGGIAGGGTGGGSTTYGDYDSGGGYSTSRYGRGGSSYGRGGSSYDGGSSYSSDPMDNLPAYADGSRHPAQTGSGLVPGGEFNDGISGSGRYRRPNYDPATFNTWRRLPARNFASQFGMPDKEPSLAQNMRWSIMDRVNQTAMGAMGGVMGGAPAQMAPAPVAGAPGQAGGMGPAGLRRMRGWAGQQNFTPAGLQDIYYNPQWLYPHINPGLKPGTAGFNQVDDLLTPNLQSLWSGSAGARKSTGVGPDNYANWVNKVVTGYTQPGGRVFNTNKLIQGLTMPQRGSTQWQAMKGNTYGENAYNLTNQIGAVAATTMNPMAASATMSYLDTLLNAAGSKNLTRNPRRQINAGAHVARHLVR